MAKQQQFKQHASTFSGGMNKDLDFSMMKPSMYIHAENLRLVSNEDNSTGALENVKGNVKVISNKYNSPYYILVGYAVNGDKVVLFYHSSNKDQSAIYEAIFDKDGKLSSYEELYNDSDLSSDDKLGFNKDTEISAILRTETENIERLYWLDGTTNIRAVNIRGGFTDSDGNYLTPDNFSPSPSFPFRYTDINLYSIGSGSLESGVVQYAFRFVSDSGSESPISTPTGMYHITSSNEQGTSTKNYKGEEQDKNTGKSFTMEINIDSGSPIVDLYDEIRVYSLFYPTLNSSPTIRELEPADIIVGTYSYKVTDNGSGYVDTLTLSEFLTESSTTTSSTSIINKASLMESKDNRLFLADIETSDQSGIDISDFDTRAFRFDDSEDPECYLLGDDGDHSFKASEGLDGVPMDHDAINPSNYGSVIKETVTELKLNPTTLEFSAAGNETKSSDLTASHDWEVTGESQLEDWITNVSPKTGTGNDTIDVEVDGNSGSERTDYINIGLVSYSDSTQLKVTQKAPSISFDDRTFISGDVMTVPANGAYRGMEILVDAADDSWKLVNNNNKWIDFHDSGGDEEGSTYTGSGDTEFYIDIASNNSGEPRTGSIKAYLTDDTSTYVELTIEQEGAYIEIWESGSTNEIENYNTDWKEDYVEFYINTPPDDGPISSMDFSVTESPSWTSVSVDDVNSEIDVSIDYNSSISERSGYITVALDEDPDLTDSILIEQGGQDPATVSVEGSGSDNGGGTYAAGSEFDLYITTENDPDNEASWSIDDGPDWLTANTQSGTGDDTVTVGIASDASSGSYYQLQVNLDDNNDSAAYGVTVE